MITSADGGVVNVGDGGTGQLFYSFDNGAVPAGWQAVTSHDPADSGLLGVVSVNTTEGHTCAGALQITIPFTAFGQSVELQGNFNGPAYVGKQFHYWVKAAVPPPADGGTAITVGQEFVAGNGQVYAQWRLTGADAALYSNQNFVNFYPPSDTAWTEIVVPLTGADGGAIAIDLAQLGANLLTNPQDAAAPTTAVLLLDDIWLE